MKTLQFAIPDEREIEVFFGQMREFSADHESAELCINAKSNPKRAEIVLDNNSRNPGIVQAIYGKLE
ncbi:MAG: hypothetical protein U1F65_07650 [Verrucomicrobiota bacterium]